MRTAWCVATFALLSMFGTGIVCAQASGSNAPLHIYVQARTPEGDPIEWLTAKDFDISAGQQWFPVLSLQTTSKKSRTPVRPTRILLMIAPTSYYSSENAIESLLLQYLPEDFGAASVAVRDRDGHTTRYAGTRAELIQELHGFHNPMLHVSQALATLARFPGQRALVYFTETGANVPPTLRRRAEQVAALTYQVGGDRGQNYVVGNEGYSTAGPAAYVPGGPQIYGTTDQGGVGILPPPPAPLYAVTKSVREVLVVRTLKDAFQNITQAGRGYYDLTVDVPPDARDLDLRLNLKDTYQLTAQDYLPGRVPPELHLPTHQVSSASARLRPF